MPFFEITVMTRDFSCLISNRSKWFINFNCFFICLLEFFLWHAFRVSSKTKLKGYIFGGNLSIVGKSSKYKVSLWFKQPQKLEYTPYLETLSAVLNPITTCRVPTSTLIGSFCIFSISKIVSNIFLTKGRDI